MKWATRPGLHVDRTACAWLIALDRSRPVVCLRRGSRRRPARRDRVLVRGLAMIRSDPEVLVLTAPLYDGLYEYLKRTAAPDGSPG